MFYRMPNYYFESDEIFLTFSILEKSFKTKARMCHSIRGYLVGYGLEFVELDNDRQKNTRYVIKKFHKMRISIINYPPEWCRSGLRLSLNYFLF